MEGGKSGTTVVSCPRCRRYYRLPRAAALAPGRKLRCTGCGHVFRLQPEAAPPPRAEEGPRVLVASDGDEVRSLVEKVLQQGGFAFRSALSGDDALSLIGQWRPSVAVLDVGIPGVPVFEICDHVRQDPGRRDMGIVLVASVYQRTRYKRSPTSLYGADDYIEKHHLRDSLIGKIERLLPGEKNRPSPPAPPYPPPVGKEKGPRPRERGEESTLVGEEQDNLRRFARIIVADIALYNQELVERGIREGTLTQLLAREIEEGRRLFETRLGAPAGAERDIYPQAVADFIEKQKTRFLRLPGGQG